MFREYRNANPHYEDYFIAYDSPDELSPDQRSKIFRPRTSDILTRFDTLRGLKYLWTTFSPDQIDLNFRNPEVLLRVIDGLLFYVRRGADILRLDAVPYIWAEPGTECVHLPQTHEIVKLLRDVVDICASGVALITETNVPHADNVSYFGNGMDEAHMVYNFALPPLVLHTFYTGDSTVISRWAEGLIPPSSTTTFFNGLDTHDGIGLLGAKEILSKDQMDSIIAIAMHRGAYVSYKRTEAKRNEPYEINSTWWSAINDDVGEEDMELKILRYTASRSLALSLRGVPGIYIHGSLGSANDRDLVASSGIYRDVNRGQIDSRIVFHKLEQSGSKLCRIRQASLAMELARTRERAFHPNGGQRILRLSPAVFVVHRSSPEKDRHVLALTNVKPQPQRLAVPRRLMPDRERFWMDLLSGSRWEADDNVLTVRLEPYGVISLQPSGMVTRSVPERHHQRLLD
jgi:sucrose phosphorylase